jgi:predicted membrane GTPase involved in stress response
VIKEKDQTNVRAAAADQLVRLVPAKRLSLERRPDLDQVARVKAARRERAATGA